MQVEQQGVHFKVEWRRGDVTRFGTHGAIIIGETVYKDNITICNTTQAPFGASDSARLLHILVDCRVAATLVQISNVRSREEVDEVTVDPCEGIAKFFNDESFSPTAVDRLQNGIQRLQIFMMDPSAVACRPTAIVLKAKWTSLKSDYSIAKANFELNGQQDHESFPNYANGSAVVTYTHAFLHRYPNMCEDAMRAVRSTAQRQEGVSVPKRAVCSSSSEKQKVASRGGTRELVISGFDKFKNFLTEDHNRGGAAEEEIEQQRLKKAKEETV